jgi:hypothetical protein
MSAPTPDRMPLLLRHPVITAVLIGVTTPLLGIVAGGLIYKFTGWYLSMIGVVP